MLDKSLPYYNIIMKRAKNTKLQKPKLPNGYLFEYYTNGDELPWAEIEVSAGEFDTIGEALEYFHSEYDKNKKELYKRMLFITSEDGLKVGTYNCWWDYKDDIRVPAVHWVGVRKEYLGLGLGKAAIFRGVERMLELEGDVDIYLHTQTWSYKAINIYLQAGFTFLKEEVFGKQENDYEKAMEVINNKIRIYK